MTEKQDHLKSNLHDRINIADFAGELFSITLNGPPRQTGFGIRQTAVLVALCWNQGNKKVNKIYLDHISMLSSPPPPAIQLPFNREGGLGSVLC